MQAPSIPEPSGIQTPAAQIPGGRRTPIRTSIRRPTLLSNRPLALLVRRYAGLTSTINLLQTQIIALDKQAKKHLKTQLNQMADSVITAQNQRLDTISAQLEQMPLLGQPQPHVDELFTFVQDTFAFLEAAARMQDSSLTVLAAEVASLATTVSNLSACPLLPFPELFDADSAPAPVSQVPAENLGSKRLPANSPTTDPRNNWLPALGVLNGIIIVVLILRFWVFSQRADSARSDSGLGPTSQSAGNVQPVASMRSVTPIIQPTLTAVPTVIPVTPLPINVKRSNPSTIIDFTNPMTFTAPGLSQVTLVTTSISDTSPPQVVPIIKSDDLNQLALPLPFTMLKAISVDSEWTPILTLNFGDQFDPVVVPLNEIRTIVRGMKPNHPDVNLMFGLAGQAYGTALLIAPVSGNSSGNYVRISLGGGSLALINDEQIIITDQVDAYYKVKIETNQLDANHPETIGKEGWILKSLIIGP